MSNFSGCPPLDVQFDVNTSTSILFILILRWIFDANSNSVSHIYNGNGIFNPILTITDSNNCQNIINMIRSYQVYLILILQHQLMMVVPL